MPMDFKSVWEAMEECHNLGLTKSIGVSNFSCEKLNEILATAKIPPAVNQVSFQTNLDHFLVKPCDFSIKYNEVYCNLKRWR